MSARITRHIVEAFAGYNARFRAITQRAGQRFRERDWTAARLDAVERIELYDLCVAECSAEVESLLGERRDDRALWSAVRDAYAEAIAGLLDQEFNKTFFNTLARRLFRIRGVDPAMEFVALDIEPTDRITHPVERHCYAAGRQLRETFRRILDDFDLGLPFADADADALAIAQSTSAQLADWGAEPIRSIELLTVPFFRERRAYLVGRIFGAQRFAPFVIALVNSAEGGLRADAVLVRGDEVSILFGYTRSYFHADLATVGDAVVFLRTLMPEKPIDELYTVLGRAKQGKTERYRHLYRHLEHSGDSFVLAEGERGMVMAVFTLPSYPLVFKLIRDRFAPPKTSGREDVIARYQFVFKHDRAGRLIDAQEFRFLRFPRKRFSQAVLVELLENCRESVIEDGEDLVIVHCYIERRLRPLNLFLLESGPDLSMRALIDYGQAIRDLALSNLFPGDLLLKNFGVTRHGRVIFYDYDELCAVTDCRFRMLPQASEDDEMRTSGEWFYVGDNDVFPEQFPDFLGLADWQRRVLFERHADLFDARWWSQLQVAHKGGVSPSVLPYPEARRLRGG